MVTNGTFDSATTGWTSDGTVTIDSNRLKITNDAANYRSANQNEWKNGVSHYIFLESICFVNSSAQRSRSLS